MVPQTDFRLLTSFLLVVTTSVFSNSSHTILASMPGFGRVCKSTHSSFGLKLDQNTNFRQTNSINFPANLSLCFIYFQAFKDFLNETLYIKQ